MADLLSGLSSLGLGKLEGMELFGEEKNAEYRRQDISTAGDGEGHCL